MIDLALVCAYFALMLTVGWRARRNSPDSYWVAERRYGAAAVGGSLVATVFGASSTIGIIGLGYSRGLTGAWWSLVGGLALIPFSFFLAGRVRRLDIDTGSLFLVKGLIAESLARRMAGLWERGASATDGVEESIRVRGRASGFQQLLRGVG